MTIGKIVTVIDDDESVRIAIEGLIRSLGHTACGFASAQHFLTSEVRSETSCLITDVQMAEVSGLDLHARLATEGGAPPVIYITAFPDERIEARARSLGAIGFLSKPFDAETLVHCIQRALASGPDGRT
ncbi:response regulator [Rhodopseudomonas sp. BR0M22]|uniref:response regulator transcription factor n=1 Tax=Rhodopseudomonas sp. BR0M22 TaxID=2269369 RepID=UPI0013DF1F2D|nr:response regulator [Rhodopseudomonas sp. BR0M22]NEW91135.1 response regulator [Rhodopseudomonas sp. BR0M22]